MNVKLKKVFAFALIGAAFFSCKKDETKITLAAAASLKNVFDKEIIPAFKKANPDVKVEATYDSSGKLQTQIESGLAADVFMSAAQKQMDALVNGGFINRDDVIDLVQNQLVLIKQKGAVTEVTGFDNVTAAKSVAIGDPASVPAGQYAKEVFENLGTYTVIEKVASLGTNVTEVLGWVSAGSAEVGVVYATDAKSDEGVEVVAFAPAELLSTLVIYPVAVTAKSEHREAAKAFVDFLTTDEALSIFETYGFTRK